VLSGAVHGAKVHLGCDADTLQIRARDHHVVGDSPVVAELLAPKPGHETGANFTVDVGSYRGLHCSLNLSESSATVSGSESPLNPLVSTRC